MELRGSQPNCKVLKTGGKDKTNAWETLSSDQRNAVFF